MTINNKNMGKSKNCLQLDPARKFKIRVNPEGKILFVNNYFTEFTGYKVHELILKDFSTLFDQDTPKMAMNNILHMIENQDKSYFFYKGKNKDGECYWGFVKSIQNFDEEGAFKGYKFEVKMLPLVSIHKIDNLMDILREIEKNAGAVAAEKYFEGYVEEKGFDNYKDFILNVVEIDEKKADKYFEIDADEEKQKKKKGWF